MTIQEFITNHNGNVDCLEIRKYIPIEEKLDWINSVLNELIVCDGRITATYNTVTLEAMRVISIISLYTNLEVNNLTDYDILVENNLIDVIYYSIGDDMLNYNQYFDDRKEDYIREKNSIDGILGRTLGEIVKLLESIDPKTLVEMLGSLQ